MNGDTVNESEITLRSVYDRLLAHENTDDLRFKQITDGFKEIKDYGKFISFGIAGALGTAILNLVIHH